MTTYDYTVVIIDSALIKMVKRELGVAVHTLNSSTREAETGESEFETCDKRKKKRLKRKKKD